MTAERLSPQLVYATSDRLAQSQSSVVRYIPRPVSSRQPMQEFTVPRTGRAYDQADYPMDDPIRSVFKEVLVTLLEQEPHYFDGDLTDCGIGNGAEEIVIGPRPKKINGVDIKGRNLDLAFAAFFQDDAISKKMTEVWNRSNGREKYFEPFLGDAVDYVAELAPGSLTGVVIANLPQVPSDDKRLTNTADNYRRIKYSEYAEKYGKYGYPLRAEFMRNARVAASPDVRVLMFFSEWFDQGVVKRMLEETGWQISRTLANPIIRQDRSTNILWLQDIAPAVDGRFFADPHGRQRLSFVDAAARWQASQGTGMHPDLYHRLRIHEIKPKVVLVNSHVVDPRQIQGAAA